MLEIQNVSKTFNAGTVNQKTALNGLNLKLNEGDFVTVIGGNGAGKSTMLNAVAGVWPVDEGKIIIDGVDVTRLSEHQRAAYIGRVFQDPMTSLDPTMQIGKQIMEGMLWHYKMPKDAAYKKAVQLLEEVGITDAEKRMKSYPHQLSGGMRQRVMIAIALACEPKLLIADEPTTALDVTIQAQILELMQDLRKKLGMSIIMITHDLGVVASMCEKIAVMYAGHIVEYGTTDEIFYQPGHEYTKGLINSIPKLNTAEHERLVPIEGTPVDLLNPPAGCPFAPRCKNCMKICLSKMPPRTELSDTHYTYCWLQQKAAFEKGEKAE